MRPFSPLLLYGLLCVGIILGVSVTLAAAQCLASGDVNDDGAITPLDVLRTLEHFLGVQQAQLDSCEAERANVVDPTTSGITPADARCIFRAFLNQASCLDNTSPVAHAGSDRIAPVGTPVLLDGSQSMDAESHSLTFLWSILNAPMGSRAALDDATAMNPTLVADLAGRYEIRLVVNDGCAASLPDSVIVEATASALDSDADGLADDEEAVLGTQPEVPDTDGDGLIDGAEVRMHGTDPLRQDTDGDGADDGTEIAAGSNPLDSSSTPDSLLTRITSSPAAGEGDVAVSRETIIHFSTPLADTVVIGTNTVFAEFGGERLVARRHMAHMHQAKPFCRINGQYATRKRLDCVCAL